MTRARSVLYATTLVALVMTSCAGMNAASCQFDTDCGTNSACIESQCYARCVTDEDCGVEPGSVSSIACRAVTPKDGEQESFGICASDDVTNNTPDSQQCSSNAECVSALDNENARCSLLNTCIIAPNEHAILIEDLSAPPGAELLAVWVADSSGATQGWGVSEDYAPSNDAESDAIFDGSPAQLSPDETCVMTPSEGEGVMLGGEGGTIRVYFVDEQGARLSLQPGWTVHVIERGANCAETEVSNEYRAKLCVSVAGDPIDSSSQCATPLDGVGVDAASFDLAL